MPGETPLERLLEAATHEIGLRPEFYRCLLATEVLVPIARDLLPGTRGTADTTLHVVTLVRHDHVAVIPFYSSSASAYQAPAVDKYALMTVRELFAAQPGMHFHLNPYSPFGREFTPEEVEKLLTYGTLGETAHSVIIEDETVRVSAPSSVPDAMLAALRVLYARHFHIQAAYLAQLARPGHSDSLLIMLDTESTDLLRVVRESATVIQDTGFGNLPVDIARLERDGSPIARYFDHATPFYERGWGARFTPPVS
jgi:hypothetical protein